MSYQSGSQLQSVLDYEYSAGNLIGHGAFALVFKGRRKRTLEVVAIKQISLKSVPGRLSNIRQKEISILKDIKHSNVVQLYDCHEDQSHIYIVMEYCNGGDLGDYLQAKQTLSEDSIRHLANHIGGALNALQRLHIIHRDIKPQNLLLSYPTAAITGSGAGSSGRRADRLIRDATIKLADFGFARYLKGSDMAATLCGSPLYMAPEILLGKPYDHQADLWSVGTILYQCLTGMAPFLATNPHALRKRYEREKLVAKVPEGTSRHLASLLTQLLKKNSQERLSHEGLCSHPFLCDPSIQASGYLVMASQPPRAKSSPVPIRRHAPSPSHFSRHPNSPLQNPFESSETYLSPSSGPPSIHPVGSAFLHHQQSPHSDVVDHGFILVGTSPHHSTSPLSSGASSYSGSYCSARSHTPSSNGHTPLSSYGSSSAQRYRSLTMPFYKAPPTPQSSNGSTPVMAERLPNSLPPTPVNDPPCPHSRFTRRASDSTAPLSHTPPFGRLMQLAPTLTPTTHQSPLSSPHTTLSRQVSSSPSPSLLNQQANSQVSVPVAVAPPAGSSSSAVSSHVHVSPRGLRYSLSAHGSSSKLSSLAEQAETDAHADEPKETKRKGKESGHFPRVSSGPCFDDLITLSQVLDSNEEEESFPLSLSLTSSQSSNKTDEQEAGEAGVKSPVRVLAAKHKEPLAKSVQKESEGERGSRCVKRAASFSHQPSSSAKPPRRSFSTERENQPSPIPLSHRQHGLQPSPAAKIKHIPLPFIPNSSVTPPPLPLSTPTRPTSRPSSAVCVSASPNLPPSPALPETLAEKEAILSPLLHSVTVARELLGMARARDGPIMLLSTDLSTSGGMSSSQRYSEQLVLYAKAMAVLESGLRQYQIEVATSSLEPGQGLHTVEAEAREMQETCLEKARTVKEEVERMRSGRHSLTLFHSHGHSSLLSAEKLLMSEALDMCKNAVLSEHSGDAKECIKRYRIAKVVFNQLLSDARTARDKTLLQNYIHSVTQRIHWLTSH